MNLLLRTTLFFLTGIILSHAGSTKGQIKPGSGFQSDSLPTNILIINSFDAMDIKTRKNKKELFVELADSLKEILYNSIPVQDRGKAIILPELLHETENPDSSIFSLMQTHNAVKIIVVKNIDVHFKQTGVEVTGEKNNKTRIASYDICSVITYSLYNTQAKHKESIVNICEFYTQRSVISGFLASGPDVVGKRKDVFKMVAKNAQLFINDYFPEPF